MRRMLTWVWIPVGILLGVLISVASGSGGSLLPGMSLQTLRGENPPRATPGKAVERVGPDTTVEGAGSFFRPRQRPHRLETFFAALERSETDGVDERVGIVQIGDSHTASDTLSGQLRRRFQTRFGSAGRGLAAPGRPWAGFRQEQMSWGMSRGWQTHLAHRREDDGPFGLGGIRLDSTAYGASLARGTCERCEFGHSFESVTVHYLRRPSGGNLTLEIDGAEVHTTSTSGKHGLGIAQLSVAPGPHELRVVNSGGGPLSVLGVRTESGDDGVTLSSLGLNGATAIDFNQRWSALAHRQLRQLDPTLLVYAFGTNGAYNLYRFAEKFADNEKAIRQQQSRWRRNYRQYVQKTLGALSSPSCLVLTPPDLSVGSCVWRRPSPDEEPICTRRPEMFDYVVRTQHEIANEFGCAIWDQAEAMGGAGSIVRWNRRTPPLAQDDGKHLTMQGYRTVADGLFEDVMASYDHWLSGETRRVRTTPVP